MMTCFVDLPTCKTLFWKRCQLPVPCNFFLFFFIFYLRVTRQHSFPAFHSIILVRTFAEGFWTIFLLWWCCSCGCVCVLISCVHTFFTFVSSSSLRHVCVCVCVCVWLRVYTCEWEWEVGWSVYPTSCDFTCGVLLHLLVGPYFMRW